jgi:hypothetical protein
MVILIFLNVLSVLFVLIMVERNKKYELPDDAKIIASNDKYRLFVYYHTFFARNAYVIQKRIKNHWVNLENDRLGINKDNWISHYELKEINQ